MGNSFSDWIGKVSNFVWGPPLLILLVGTGIYLTIRLGFIQITKLPYALKLAFSKHQDDKSEGDISHFQALMTALAATVGTGNIVGVATAVVLGGPGAIVWMWCPVCSGWQRSTRKRFLPSNIASSMKKDRWQEDRCITLSVD